MERKILAGETRPPGSGTVLRTELGTPQRTRTQPAEYLGLVRETEIHRCRKGQPRPVGQKSQEIRVDSRFGKER